MEQHKLTLEHGHILAYVDNTPWIIDTGSPISFGDRPALNFLGRQYSIPQTNNGLGISQINHLAGLSVTGLLGMDILSQHHSVFDLPSNTWQIHQEGFQVPATNIPLSFIMGIPVVTVEAQGQTWQFFLDTGSQIHYWNDTRLASQPAIGLFDDFYPGFGPFSTHLYPFCFAVGKHNFENQAGVLPQLLAMPLKMAGVEGVIGNSIFLHDPVYFSPIHSSMSILSEQSTRMTQIGI